VFVSCGGGGGGGGLSNIIGEMKSSKSEVGGACSTCGGKKRCVQDFGGVT
jgi:hypothetical protein